MKKLLFLLSIFSFYGCNLNCENCNPRTGPMISKLGSLRWVKTQTPTRQMTPQTAGCNIVMLRLNVHMYVLRNDSIIERRKLHGTGTEDWGNHRVVLNYENGTKQLMQFVYEGNDNRNSLNEVILSDIFTEPYDAKSDTVRMHFVSNGPVDDKYLKDEEKLLNGK